jgi:hypothetical protein
MATRVPGPVGRRYGSARLAHRDDVINTFPMDRLGEFLRKKG